MEPVRHNNLIRIEGNAINENRTNEQAFESKICFINKFTKHMDTFR